jgi:hypothetical protein
MKSILVGLVMLSASSPLLADSWTQQLGIVKVNPLVAWQGGMVRVVVDATVTTTNCGTGTVLDFIFSGGTQESRSAALSALYMAMASGKRVEFYLSSTACSSVGSPVITGLNVLN